MDVFETGGGGPDARRPMARPRGFWQRVVATWERGGETQAEVAARFGVSRSAVGYGAVRLRRERDGEPAAELLPVRISEEREAGGVEVRVGDVTHDRVIQGLCDAPGRHPFRHAHREQSGPDQA